MPGKPKSRNWNDVQTAIATAAIVFTLGLWNLFATPSKVVKAAETREPSLPPTAAEPPGESDSAPTAAPPMPQVKIIFTPGVTPVVQQGAQQVQQLVKKKNKNNESVSVAQTRSS